MENEPQDIIKQINRVLKELDSLEPNDPHYKDLVARLGELLKAQDHLEALRYEDVKRGESWIWRVIENGPVVTAVGTVVLGIGILGHERSAIIVSKAFSLLRFR